MMAWVDKRLRQATTIVHIPFGVTLIGDFAQLPPVGDRPPFASEEANGIFYYRILGLSLYPLPEYDS